MIFAIYCSGVSIECVLRAYIARYTKEFDSEHDLEKLFFKSLISQKIESDEEKISIMASIKSANEIWSNDLRYFSEKRMKRILAHNFVKNSREPKDINKYLKNKYSEISETANKILEIGKKQWN